MTHQVDRDEFQRVRKRNNFAAGKSKVAKVVGVNGHGNERMNVGASLGPWWCRECLPRVLAGGGW